MFVCFYFVHCLLLPLLQPRFLWQAAHTTVAESICYVVFFVFNIIICVIHEKSIVSVSVTIAAIDDVMCREHWAGSCFAMHPFRYYTLFYSSILCCFSY